MHFLPSYSPNLNPIERLWKLMNEQLHNKYFERFKGFRDAVLGFLQGLLDPPDVIREVLERRITDRFRVTG
jgi:transposase